VLPKYRRLKLHVQTIQNRQIAPALVFELVPTLKRKNTPVSFAAPVCLHVHPSVATGGIAEKIVIKFDAGKF
jgi:hypothetical protein